MLVIAVIPPIEFCSAATAELVHSLRSGAFFWFETAYNAPWPGVAAATKSSGARPMQYYAVFPAQRLLAIALRQRNEKAMRSSLNENFEICPQKVREGTGFKSTASVMTLEHQGFT